jgi:hypothetical protein
LGLEEHGVRNTRTWGHKEEHGVRNTRKNIGSETQKAHVFCRFSVSDLNP